MRRSLSLGRKPNAKARQAGRELVRDYLTPAFVELGEFYAEPQGDYGRAVTGYGSVDGRLVFVWAQDATVVHGGMGKAQAQKTARLLGLAVKAGAPVVSILDSRGARISEGLDSLAAYGIIAEALFAASGVVPQIAVVTGTCAGAASTIAAAADFVVMAENAELFLQSPAVLEAKGLAGGTGGALWASKRGLSHLTAADELACMSLVRNSFIPAVQQPRHGAKVATTTLIVPRRSLRTSSRGRHDAVRHTRGYTRVRRRRRIYRALGRIREGSHLRLYKPCGKRWA